ncbi:hypothetical protein [Paenibacillus hexagrammi]|uniref:Uncharacterized protein n=1 Tax=Paenibacillus hexagrammi TaxID=2908839 RepID=A0ABY3SBV8_9BACL|nr:hypothetical protein [Paenibacillus sp. YPD9-1]UJF31406.1 hypothetical protein L0M14_16370 [Paenibacillus sp. YPD9-1]
MKFNNLIKDSKEKLTTLETLAQGNYFRYLLQERGMRKNWTLIFVN